MGATMYKFMDRSATASPSGYARRGLLARKGIVIHTTEGHDSLAWLQRDEPIPARRSSCDYLINRTGDVLQVIPGGMYSYHSGPARWQVYQDVDGTLNKSFVGIELENYSAGGERVTGEQYIACGALVRALMAEHAISPHDVVGHNMVALPRGRKQDPVTFNWGMFGRELVAPSFEAGFLIFPEVLL